MKNLSIMLCTLMLVCTISVTAFAEVPSQPISDNQTEISQEFQPSTDPIPQIVDITPEYTEESELPAEEADEQSETTQEDPAESPEKPKSSNTPYFIGAVIAVVVFIGVALYCKFKGNGNINR